MKTRLRTLSDDAASSRSRCSSSRRRRGASRQSPSPPAAAAARPRRRSRSRRRCTTRSRRPRRTASRRGSSSRTGSSRPARSPARSARRSCPAPRGGSGRRTTAAAGSSCSPTRATSQIVWNQQTVTVYDASSNTVYRAALPQHAEQAATRPARFRSVREIASFLASSAGTRTYAGATRPTSAGQPAYSVRVSPKHDGGLLGAAELAWDATAAFRCASASTPRARRGPCSSSPRPTSRTARCPPATSTSRRLPARGWSTSATSRSAAAASDAAPEDVPRPARPRSPRHRSGRSRPRRSSACRARTCGWSATATPARARRLRPRARRDRRARAHGRRRAARRRIARRACRRSRSTASTAHELATQLGTALTVAARRRLVRPRRLGAAGRGRGGRARARMSDALPVAARGLVKRYGEIVAVDHVDLTVEPGDVFGYLGPNGAGKTTSLRMLLGLIRPTRGLRRAVRPRPARGRRARRSTASRASSRRRASTRTCPAARTCGCSPTTTSRCSRAASTRCSTLVELRDRAEGQGRRLLARDAPAARDRRVAPPQPAAAAARRADDRARSGRHARHARRSCAGSPARASRSCSRAICWARSRSSATASRSSARAAIVYEGTLHDLLATAADRVPAARDRAGARADGAARPRAASRKIARRRPRAPVPGRRAGGRRDLDRARPGRASASPRSSPRRRASRSSSSG